MLMHRENFCCPFSHLRSLAYSQLRKITIHRDDLSQITTFVIVEMRTSDLAKHLGLELHKNFFRRTFQIRVLKRIQRAAQRFSHTANLVRFPCDIKVSVQVILACQVENWDLV